MLFKAVLWTVLVARVGPEAQSAPMSPGALEAKGFLSRKCLCVLREIAD